MGNLSEFAAEEEIIVTFVEMDNSETVNGWVPGFFFNHGGDNVFPSREAEAVGCGVLNTEVVGLPQKVFGIAKQGAFIFLVEGDAMRLE